MKFQKALLIVFIALTVAAYIGCGGGGGGGSSSSSSSGSSSSSSGGGYDEMTFNTNNALALAKTFYAARREAIVHTIPFFLNGSKSWITTGGSGTGRESTGSGLSLKTETHIDYGGNGKATSTVTINDATNQFSSIIREYKDYRFQATGAQVSEKVSGKEYYYGFQYNENGISRVTVDFTNLHFKYANQEGYYNGSMTIDLAVTLNGQYEEKNWSLNFLVSDAGGYDGMRCNLTWNDVNAKNKLQVGLTGAQVIKSDDKKYRYLVNVTKPIIIEDKDGNKSFEEPIDGIILLDAKGQIRITLSYDEVTKKSFGKVELDANENDSWTTLADKMEWQQLSSQL